MTAGTVTLLKKKILASRMRLMNSHSFFALMLMHMRFVAQPEIKQMSTDGISIFLNPDFLLSLGTSETDYLLCHQMMHILCGHIWRPLAFAGEGYHARCDETAEKLLHRCGLQKKVCAHYRIAFPSSASRYELRMIDTDCCWSGGSGGTLVLNAAEEDLLKASVPAGRGGASQSKDKDEENPGDLRMRWRVRMTAAAEQYQLQKDPECEWVGELLERALGKADAPAVDWRKVLWKFVQEQTFDYSFDPPDRRYQDSEFFLPDLNEEGFGLKDVLFWVDTSGSIDQDTLASVYGELLSAMTQFQGKLQGKLGFFDADASPLYPFASVTDLKKIVPMGGGGTDFYVPFHSMVERYQRQLPACVVIFTDGESDFPPEKFACGVPVLWVFTQKDAAAPWGNCIWM